MPSTADTPLEFPSGFVVEVPQRSQASRHIGVKRHPFPSDVAAPGMNDADLQNVLLLKSFSVTEGLGTPYSIELECVSRTNGIPRHAMLGRDMSIRLNYLDDTGVTQERYWHGMITRFAQVGGVDALSRYRVTLSPWLAFLSRKSDCKVHRGSVLNIVQDIFDSYNFSGIAHDLSTSISGTYPAQEFVVQYRETDFQFVSRLLEQAGIYYYFEHTDSGHTLIAVDSRTSVLTWPDGSDPTYSSLEFTAANPGDERLLSWDVERVVQPGSFTHRSYHPDLPSDVDTALGTLTHEAVRDAALSDAYDTPFDDLVLFDYPGEFEKAFSKTDRPIVGDAYADVRMEELVTRQQTFVGEATTRGIAPGFKYGIGGLTAAGLDGSYVAITATHRGLTDGYDSSDTAGPGTEAFRTAFTAIEDLVQFRPPRRTPKPIVQGPQTATVVNPTGVTIEPDVWGSVYIFFHWDRVRDSATSAVRVRVSQPWAGAAHGSVFIPEAGDEVIIEFLEGDPDRPIITGRVYNDSNVPFLNLPDEKDVCLLGKDDYGNFILLDKLEGSEAIVLNSPNNSTSIVLGPDGIEEKTVAGSSNVTVGDKASFTYGNTFGLSVGNSTGMTFGSSWSFNLGPSVGIDLAITSSKVSVGNSFSASFGYQCSYNKGGGYGYARAPTLTEGGESVDNNVGLRGLNSYKEVRLYAGPDGKAAPTKASLITMTGDTLTLAYGKGVRDVKEGIHNVKLKVVAANIAAIVAAGAAAGGAAAAASIAEATDTTEEDGTSSGRHRPGDSRDTIRPGPTAANVAGTAIGTLATFGLAAVSAAILKNLGDRSAPMKDKLSVNDSRIDMNQFGVTLDSKHNRVIVLHQSGIKLDTTISQKPIKLESGNDITLKSGPANQVEVNGATFKSNGKFDFLNFLIMP